MAFQKKNKRKITFNIDMELWTRLVQFTKNIDSTRPMNVEFENVVREYIESRDDS